MICLKAEIRRNSDGEIATHIFQDWKYNQFWWEEGNAACDCNREIFFCRGLGVDEPEEPECGDSRYSVRLSDLNTSEVLYNELEDD